GAAAARAAPRRRRLAGHRERRAAGTARPGGRPPAGVGSSGGGAVRARHRGPAHGCVGRVPLPGRRVVSGPASVDPLPMSDDRLSLADLLNRVLDRGVVVTGDALSSAAGIDLVRLSLRLVLTSIEAERSASA